MVVGDILEAELVKLQELKKIDKQSGGLCLEDLFILFGYMVKLFAHTSWVTWVINFA